MKNILSSKKLKLKTQDGVEIVGDLYGATQEKAPAVILLHMMPATKESWHDFAPLLVELGFQVLAFDERGHGESILQFRTTAEDEQTEQVLRELDYKKFSNEQQQKKMLDILAAREFFIKKGVALNNIFIGGASIGANLAIQYLAENQSAKAVFALSPGYNYFGIETEPLMKNMREEQSILFAAAKDDPNVPDSYKAVEELANLGKAKKEVKIFETGGHGTDIFKEHPDFMTELADWLFGFIQN